jgi:hypothetical protein
MHPVIRGSIPQIRGKPQVFTLYRQARDPLIARIGDYCSYCEMPCNEGPDVEHVRPKSGKAGNPQLELVWENFLLGCCYCNSIKGHKAVSLSEYYWPDRDNTFKPFRYDRDRVPQLVPGMTRKDKLRAQRTLMLTGLDREPGHPSLSDRDTRWIKRREAWGKALVARERLARVPSSEMRDQIVDTATSTGFFSVWMTVFEGEIDLRKLFLKAFPGTSGIGECFDINTHPVPRPDGAI